MTIILIEIFNVNLLEGGVITYRISNWLNNFLSFIFVVEALAAPEQSAVKKTLCLSNRIMDNDCSNKHVEHTRGDIC